MWTTLIGAAWLAASPVTAPPTDEQAVRAHSLDVLIRRLDHLHDQSKKPAIVSWIRSERERLLSLGSREEFLTALNAGLFEKSRDKHLSVFFRAPEPPPTSKPDGGSFGIVKTEILRDGTAYLELDGFSGEPESVAAIDAAMARLAGAPALIVDLRRNGGGGEASFLRLLGHLFPQKTEITSIEWRECAPPPPDRPDACTQVAPRLQRRYTDAPQKPAFPTQPVMVLVSDKSFSAAEAVAHELQTQGRATIVGERTPGGGSPSAGMDLESDYVAIIPIGRGIPLKGSNFEGVGVAPDIAVSADAALGAALDAIGRTRKQPSGGGA